MRVKKRRLKTPLAGHRTRREPDSPVKVSFDESKVTRSCVRRNSR
jgi:hypothetical protein